MQPDWAAGNITTAIVNHLTNGGSTWHVTEVVQLGPSEFRVVLAQGGSTPYSVLAEISVSVVPAS